MCIIVLMIRLALNGAGWTSPRLSRFTRAEVPVPTMFQYKSYYEYGLDGFRQR
jgi:hypothetical protein